MEAGKSNRLHCVRFVGVMQWHAFAWERSASGQRTLVSSQAKSTVKPPCSSALAKKHSPSSLLMWSKGRFRRFASLPTRINSHASEENDAILEPRVVEILFEAMSASLEVA